MLDLDVTGFNEGLPGGGDGNNYWNTPWYGELVACTACGARAEASRVVPGAGPLDAEFMFLGQNPGEDEDQSGTPFVGRGGEELNVWMKLLGLDRTKVLVSNILHCHTTDNRAPKVGEIHTCTRLWLKREIETFTGLRVILPLGVPATKAVLGTLESPGVMRPYWVTVKFGDRQLRVVPLPHPAFLLRAANRKPEMYTQMLPKVRDYLSREESEAYERAKIRG